LTTGLADVQDKEQRLEKMVAEVAQTHMPVEDRLSPYVLLLYYSSFLRFLVCGVFCLPLCLSLDLLLPACIL
jgi:hypothetical protein